MIQEDKIQVLMGEVSPSLRPVLRYPLVGSPQESTAASIPLAAGAPRESGDKIQNFSLLCRFVTTFFKGLVMVLRTFRTSPQK
jgi:hypothetical protein